ncbi:acetate/propionate family kinase [Candidatus Pacearchaeota archaeon]|nr:acetate/propionate family kinase [Candidatus Pacearchaeota archaeon]
MKKNKKILVFNVGSSSIKYSLFHNLKRISSGNKERLKTKHDYQKAVKEILEKFKQEKINLIAHRVVHGGDLNKPSKINREIKNKIKEFSEFAPLHNPKQLMVIELIDAEGDPSGKKNSKIPQYALFDTMFFSDLPEVSKTYAIPKALTKKLNIRRYGFHGFSHHYVSKSLKGKTITCHLGSGSSISAIINGKPIDTSMGLTPLEGLIMGTRSGNIDPGLILYLEKKGYNTNEILNKKSGLKGICGHNDFRDILQKMNKDKNCKLAYNMFIYRIVKIIGSYITAMNGLNNLVFTAAIGENVPRLRKDICKQLSFMKLKLNKKKNQKNKEIISSINSKVKVFVKKTNEEQMIVEEVLKCL